MSKFGRWALAHVETWRPYTACYVGLVGLAGAALVEPHPPAARLLAAWAVPTLGWLGGLYGGDFFDRKLDAIAKPHRPIPSGRIRAGTALGMLIACTVVGGLVGVLLNWRVLVLVLAATATGIGYSTLFKAHGFAGNAMRGVITAFAFLFGAMMVTDWPPVYLVPLAVVFWAHDAGSNLVGTLRDVDGDRAGGYHTLPVRRGTDFSVRVVTACFVVSYGCALFGLVAPAGSGWTAGYATGLVLCAVLVTRAVGLLGERPLSRRTALRSHEVLCVERILLAGALACLGLGWVGVPITLLAAGIAGLSQRVLRTRYEFAPADAGPVEPQVVQDYVTTQLSALAGRERALSALSDWDRAIEIRLREPDLTIVLVAQGGAVRQLSDGEEAPDLPRLTIGTTGEVFRDIFLRGTSNPRRAYLTRKLSMDASARDMMHLNQLFNEFRGTPEQRGNWTVSAQHDDKPAADLPGELPQRVVISDTTLRDGEQMPGVAFRPAVKVALARRLSGLGIPLLEVGFPAVSEDERAAIGSIVDAGLDSLIQVISRPADGDVRAALDTGAHSVAIFIGTSESHLRNKLRLDVDEAIRRVDAAVRKVKRAGRQAVFAAEDATRTAPDVLCRVYAAAAEAGADALGLADTAGIATPWTMRALVAEVGERCPLPLAVHCHNDLGLATANSIAGLLGGASGVQCSVLGIGERAGNAPLEQVVMSLEAGYRHRTGLDLRQLESLAAHVAELVGAAIPPFMPVVGDHAFVHESGLHVDGITRDPSTYEPYPPELVGRQRRIVLGKHSGRSAVLEVAEQNGLTLSNDQAELVLAKLKFGGLDVGDVASVIKQHLEERAST